MPKLVAFLAGTALLLSACGGDSIGRSPILQEGLEAATTTTSAARLTTYENLRSALLTIDDMPTGYSAEPPEADEDREVCPGHKPSAIDKVAEVEASFTKGMFGPFVGHGVSAYVDDGLAKRYMAEWRAAIRECGTFETTEDDGTKSKSTISALSFPNLGDETASLRMTVHGDLPVSGDIVIVRYGTIVSFVLNLGLGGAQDTEKFVRKADSKVAALK